MANRDKMKKVVTRAYIKKKLCWLLPLYYMLAKILRGAKRCLGNILACLLVRNKTTAEIKVIYQTKIYDCFTFFNERDMLEMRLNILYPVVDYFVIVEATKAHSGENKVLHYLENKKRYKKFKDKIIHIIVDDMPAVKGGNRWPLENHQRDQIVKGLANCNPSDIVMVSDVDEVPNPERLGAMVVLLNTIYKVLCFRQKYYLYYLNGLVRSYYTCGHLAKYWFGTTCCKASTLLTDYGDSPTGLRGFRLLESNYLDPGGWHFSWLGDINHILYKISSYAHSEIDSADNKEKKSLHEKIERGINITDTVDPEADRNDAPRIEYKEEDLDWPQHVLENRKHYQHLIKNV